VKRRKKGGDGVGDDDSEYTSREVRLHPHLINLLTSFLIISVPGVSLVQKSRNRKIPLVVFMENEEHHHLIRLNRGIELIKNSSNISSNDYSTRGDERNHERKEKDAVTNRDWSVGSLRNLIYE
jgi:hypothetical protein